MKITEQDVAHIAALANLEFTAEESERMRRDLKEILEYIDQLNEVSTDGIAPLAHAAAITPRFQDQQNRGLLRADETRPSLPHDDAMRNAPDSDGTYFRVPKVIER